MVVGSLVEALLIAVFFLVPFRELWTQLPAAPAPSDVNATPSGDWSGPFAVAVMFGLPSLIPFALLARLAWDRRTHVSMSRGMTVATVALILLPAAVSLATYPCCTGDVLDYVNRQRLWVAYAGNPFVVLPADHPEDWSYALAHADSIIAYGPVWWLLTRAFVQWATTLDEYLLGLKLLAAVCFGISAALIWRLADRRTRLLSLAFFAWNPALLVEGLLRLHNDLLTVPFVLGAVWLHQRGRASSSLVTAALGALVKVSVAPVGLVIAVGLLKSRRWRALAIGLVGSAMVVSALYAPFWFGPGTLATLFVLGSHTQWSVGSLLVFAIGPWLGSAALSAVHWLLILACTVLTVALLLKLPASASLVGASMALLLVWALCLPMAFYSHYLMPAVALAAIAVDERLRALLLAIGFGAMVNSVLGVDEFAGGLSGRALDVVGSCALILGLAAGFVAMARSTRAQAARAG